MSGQSLQTKKTSPWHLAYQILAQALHSFQKDNPENPQKELLNLVQSKEQDFEAVHQWVKSYRQGWINDYPDSGIDPMQVFVSVSGNKTLHKKRTNRVNKWLELLGQGPNCYGEIDYDGCPAITPIMAQRVRIETAQKQIWEFFRAIMNETKDEEVFSVDFWNQVVNWRGVAHRSLTMLPFWVNSDRYLPLDGNTESFLKKFLVVDGKKNLFEHIHYSAYVKRIRSHNLAPEKGLFREIVRQAGIDNWGDLDEKQFSSNLNALLGKKTTPLPGGSFRLLALRTFPESNSGTHNKILKPGTIFPFDKSFEFLDSTDSEIILYDPAQNPQFFQLNSTNGTNPNQPTVNVHAIVGKNGVGKSTIVDLLLKAIHELARSSSVGTGLEEISGLRLALYFHSAARLRKLSIENGEAKIQEFGYKDNEDGTGKFTIEDSSTQIDSFQLKDFFYTVVVNYSLYAFRKDSCFFPAIKDSNIPMAIEPDRKDGNIDMNTVDQTEELRLLRMLFVYEGEDSGKEFRSVRELTDDLEAVEVEFRFGRDYSLKSSDPLTRVINDFISKEEYREERDRFETAIQEKFGSKKKDWLSHEFSLDPGEDPGNKESRIRKWVIIRMFEYLIRWASNNPEVKKRHLLPAPSKPYAISLKSSKEKDPLTLVDNIYNDRSHNSVLFLQTVNFLRFDLWEPELQIFIKEKEQGQNLPLIIDIVEGARRIHELINQLEDGQEEDQSLKYTPEEFLPPIEFKPEIKLQQINDPTTGIRISLKDLSSGQIQRIYTGSNIYYHLSILDSEGKSLNAQSITETNSIASVNLILDEIELYYHPEYQRTYLAYLLDLIGRMPLDHIKSINILFVTHSPYILSDIPHPRVLRLELDEQKRAVPNSSNSHKTLAANVHDLLKDSFFMEEGLIGEFAKNQIKELSVFLSPPLESDHSKSYWNKVKARKTIDLIGEPLLTDALEKLFVKKYGEGDRINTLNRQIEALKKELQTLKQGN